MNRTCVVALVLCLFFLLTLSAAALETKELTLEQAIALLLDKNPDLQALRLEEESAISKSEKAHILLASNPTAEVYISKKDRPEDEGGGKYTNYGIKVSQEFEIAGQRGARIEFAEKELARVRAEIKDKERVLISDVKDAFARSLALKIKTKLAREIVRLNEEFLGYTKIKYEAGDVSGLDVNLSEVELSKMKRELLLAEREYRESLLFLRGLLGLSPDIPLALVGDLPSRAPVLPDKEAVKTSALSQRPDSKAAALETGKTQAALALIKKEAFPNITLAGFYDRDEDRDVVGLGISFPLPFFDRMQAEKKEVFAKSEVARIKAAGLQKAIEREVDQAYSNLTSAIEELMLFRNEVLAKAAENLNLLNLAYKEGKIGYFEVRLAQRDTIEAQLAYIEAQARTQLALNAIEKTTGGTVK